MTAIVRSVRPLPLFLIALVFATGCNRPEHRLPADLELFIDRYFEVWSSQDMDAYAACFHPQARVTQLGANPDEAYTQGLTDFLHGQRMSHLTSTVLMKEWADSKQGLVQDRSALVHVLWTLDKGGQLTRGVDEFSLIRIDGKWQIIHLTFYSLP